MALENGFFSVLPIVESLARSTIFSSTTFFSNSRRVQRTRPLGGSEQARAISWLPSRRQKSAQPFTEISVAAIIVSVDRVATESNHKKTIFQIN
jgi:hypothetical protein